MARLAVPLAGSVLFFLFALATVRFARPKEPRRVFLIYALVLLAASATVLVVEWPLGSGNHAIAMAACLTLQLLACLTVWNTFYSLLWGFSGSLMYEIRTDTRLRDRERLIASYEGTGGVDRMMARRLPNLVRGGWIAVDERTLHLQPKGRTLAAGARLARKVFSLGAAGGIK